MRGPGQPCRRSSADDNTGEGETQSAHAAAVTESTAHQYVHSAGKPNPHHPRRPRRSRRDDRGVCVNVSAAAHLLLICRGAGISLLHTWRAVARPSHHERLAQSARAGGNSAARFSCASRAWADRDGRVLRTQENAKPGVAISPAQIERAALVGHDSRGPALRYGGRYPRHR